MEKINMRVVVDPSLPEDEIRCHPAMFAKLTELVISLNGVHSPAERIARALEDLGKEKPDLWQVNVAGKTVVVRGEDAFHHLSDLDLHLRLQRGREPKRDGVRDFGGGGAGRLRYD